MNKHKQLLIFISLFYCQFAFSQNHLAKQWDYRFGGTDKDALTAFQQTKDGGFILGGYTQSNIGGDKTQNTIGFYDYWIVKVDSLGNKEWDKDFGGASFDYLYSLQQTADGGYILGGQSNSGIGGDKSGANFGLKDYWILKIDSLGNKQWDKTFGGAQDDQLYSVQQTADGGYIAGGYSSSGISGNKTQPSKGGTDYWIVKTDSLGNMQWDKDYGTTGFEYLNSIKQTTDSGFILGGQTDANIGGDKTQPSKGGYDFWIIKTDALGAIQWDKDFGGTSNEIFYDINQTADGGFILGGLSPSGTGGDKTQPTWGLNDYWIVKTDSLGIKQWDKDFGGTAAEYEMGKILQTTDGGYLVSGTSFSAAGGNKTQNNLADPQTWVLKTDTAGNIEWDRTLLCNGTNTTSSRYGMALELTDGCFAFANHTDGAIGGDKSQASRGSNDYWIVKLCDTTLTAGIYAYYNSELPMSVLPNPFTSTLSIEFGKQQVTPYTVSVKNVLGQMVFYSNRQTIADNLELDLSFLQSGIYFLEVKSNDAYQVIRILKE